MPRERRREMGERMQLPQPWMAAQEALEPRRRLREARDRPDGRAFERLEMRAARGVAAERPAGAVDDRLGHHAEVGHLAAADRQEARDAVARRVIEHLVLAGQQLLAAGLAEYRPRADDRALV